MQRNLDIGTLRSFITIIDMAGVTKAANRLNLTQSTVSMQIKRLEETLDMSLLERDGRSMRPTYEGEQLLTFARKMIAINDEAIDRLVNHDHSGELRFGVPIDLADAYVPEILKQFVHDYPQVKVSLQVDGTTSLLEKYHSGKLDIILTTEFQTGANGHCLLDRELLWTGAIGGQAWTRDPLPIAFTLDCMFRQPAIDALEAEGIEWVDVLQSNNHSFDSGSIACAADLGIRADIAGFLAHGMEALESSGTRLPKLPHYQVNAYLTDGPNQEIAHVLLRLIQSVLVNEAGEDYSDRIIKFATSS